MKTFKLTLYKDSGKYYSDDTIYTIEAGYVDVRSLVIEEYKNKWDGYITVHELQEDGHLQPIRLITKEELNTLSHPNTTSSIEKRNKENTITSSHEYKKGRGWSSSI